MASDSSGLWDKIFDAEMLRINLTSCSLFICAFEMFRDTVISRPKTFFMDGFDKNGPITGEEYRNEVLSLDSNPFRASLRWFKKMDALSSEDLDTIDRIRKHRNELTHEMVRFVTESEKNLDVDLYQALIEIFIRLERWWFSWFETSVQPESIPDGASSEDVQSSQVMLLNHMLEIAVKLGKKGSRYH